MSDILKDLTKKLATAKEKRENLSGQAKFKATQGIKALQAEIDELNSSKAEEPKAEVKVVATKKEGPKMLIVVNKSNFMKVDPVERTRFNPNLEVATKLTGWVKAQLEAKIFEEVVK